MANGKTDWALAGDYFENCDCELLCPCLLTHMKAEPTEGNCSGLMAFHIERGHFGNTDLSGLNAAFLFSSDGPMERGDWKAAYYIDERADAEQESALRRIFTGETGGPMAMFKSFIGPVLGVRSAPISYSIDGKIRTVSIPDVTEMSVEGIEGAPGQQIWLENVPHPVSSRLAAAVGTQTWIRDHGIDLDNSGKNGHFSAFEWQG